MASGVCTYVRVPRAGRRIAAGSTAYVVRTSYVTYVSPLAWRRWQSNSDRPIDPLNPFFPPSFRPWHWTTTTHHTTPACPAPLLPAQRVQRSSKNRHLISITTHSSAAASSIRYHPITHLTRAAAGAGAQLPIPTASLQGRQPHQAPRLVPTGKATGGRGGCVPWPSTSVPIIPPKAMAEANPNQTATAGAPSHGF